MPLLCDAQMPYDRKSVTPGILHFGVGQFCRGHLFYYTHRVLELMAKEGGGANKTPLDWGIIGVNVMAGDRERQMGMDFRRQNCLYSVNFFPHSMDGTGGKGESAPQEPQSMVIGSMIDYVYAPEEQAKVMSLLVDPRIRIVSMTITEGGYNIDESTNEFDLRSPAVRADLSHPRNPSTTFGLIVEGLRRRRESGETAIMPFTVMSCDNLRHNGNVAKKAILGYARALDPSLADWIEKNVSFPNSMVDRITPVTTPEIKKRMQCLPNGFSDDEEPVIGEAFSQWVLEDKFVKGVRPCWEKVGLELTNDVTGYEYTKIRILNSSHMFVTFPGLLLGYRMVHEALADKDVYQLVNRTLDMDVLPTLTSPMDKFAYKKTVLARFSNAAIADQLLRIAGDGTSKVQVFWTNTIMAILERAEKHGRDAKKTGPAHRKRKSEDEGLDNFAFGLASYLMYLRGKDCHGREYPVLEPKLTPENWQSVMEFASAPKFIGNRDKAMAGFNAFDTWRDKASRPILEQRMLFYYHAMRTKGVREAMQMLPGWVATECADAANASCGSKL